MSPWKRTAACLPAAVTAGFIYWLSNGPLPPGTLPSFAFSDKVAHTLAFGFFTLTLLPALRLGAGLPWARCTRFALLGGLLYGAFDEVHQGWVPGREKDMGDFLADTTGATAAFLLARRLRPPKVPHDLPATNR